MKTLFCFVLVSLTAFTSAFAETTGLISKGEDRTNLKANEKVVLVEANKAVLQEISSWNPKIVFFTSASNPIKRLKDVKNDQNEIGITSTSLYRKVRNLTKISDMPESETLYLNPELFSKNETLRLLVTWDDPAWVNEIVSTGGGVRVKLLTWN